MDKYTIVLTCYNQSEYIFEAIDSIINQTYKNIELIITDDFSYIFPQYEIEKHLQEANLNNYIIIRNKKNIGTVKTIIKAIKKSSGKYIHFLAADDKLGDIKLIDSFIKKMQKNEKINVLSSICLICEKDFNIVRYQLPSNDEIENINKKNAEEQFKMLSFGTIVAIGGTVFRTSELKKRKYLKSKNKYIEDLELFLKLTLYDNKITVLDLIGLYHRSGGISERKDLKNDVKISYLKDFENIYKNIIFKNIKRFSINERKKLFEYYNTFKDFYPDVRLISICSELDFINNNKEYLLNTNKINWYKDNIIYVLKLIVQISFILIIFIFIRRFNYIYMSILLPIIYFSSYIIFKLINKAIRRIYG